MYTVYSIANILVTGSQDLPGDCVWWFQPCNFTFSPFNVKRPWSTPQRRRPKRSVTEAPKIFTVTVWSCGSSRDHSRGLGTSIASQIPKGECFFVRQTRKKRWQKWKIFHDTVQGITFLATLGSKQTLQMNFKSIDKWRLKNSRGRVRSLQVCKFGTKGQSSSNGAHKIQNETGKIGRLRELLDTVWFGMDTQWCSVAKRENLPSLAVALNMVSTALSKAIQLLMGPVKLEVKMMWMSTWAETTWVVLVAAKKDNRN